METYVDLFAYFHDKKVTTKLGANLWKVPYFGHQKYFHK